MDIISEKILFTGSQGHLLVGRLDRPVRDARAYAVYAPCFTCTKDILVAKRIGEELARRGIGMLRIDFTGLGESGGSFTQANFTSNTEDLIAAANFLEAHFQAPQLVIGHSLGGTTALVAATKLPAVRGVVTINSPSNPKHVGKRFEEKLEELSWTEEVDVKIEGRDFRIQKQFVDDLQNYDMDTILPNLNAALLVFHAPEDPVVNVRNASAIFSTAVHPKSFIALHGVDHLVTKKDDAIYIARMIDAWSTPYLIPAL